MKHLLHTTCNVHIAHSRHSHSWQWKRFTVTNLRYLVRFEWEYICYFRFFTLWFQFPWSIASVLFILCIIYTLRISAMPWKWLLFRELPLYSISMIKRCAKTKNPKKMKTHSKHGTIHFTKLNAFCLFCMTVYVCMCVCMIERERE